MTKQKRDSEPSDFLSNLERAAEILPQERLLEIQKLLEAGDQKEEVLLEKLGTNGLALATMGQAVLSHPAILRATPEVIANRLRELGSRLQSSAPALLAHPRVQAVAESVAKRFVDAPKADDKSEEEVRLPYDDVAGFGASTMYLEWDELLAPTVRCEITFSNRSAFPPVTLRLIDVVLLASSFTESLANALESSSRLAHLGILAESEIDDVRKHLEELLSATNRVNEALKRSSSSKSARNVENA